jgi:hypothetical protein
MRFVLLAILVLGLAATAVFLPDGSPPPVIGNPPVIVEVLDPSLTFFAPMWRREVARRFPNAVAVLCHGGNFVEDEWIIGASFPSTDRHVTRATDVVVRMQKRYPGRTIVLLACNPGHLTLGIKGVAYFKNSVWCVPDREITPEMFRGSDPQSYWKLDASRWQTDGDTNGNIFEAVVDN